MTGSVPVPLPVTISEDMVIHFLGYPPGRELPDRTRKLLDPTLEEARTLVEATGVYRILPPDMAEKAGLAREEADRLALGMVTAGAAIEDRAGRLMHDGRATAALLMDAAGSAAAEEAADLLGGVIVGDYRPDTPAPTVGCRISPGYGDWRLESQVRLFGLLPHDRLGIRLLPSMLMVPRKSISFAMWLGGAGQPEAVSSGCHVCELERCLYRREGTGGRDG